MYEAHLALIKTVRTEGFQRLDSIKLVNDSAPASADIFRHEKQTTDWTKE